MSTLVVSQIEDSGGASLLGRTNAIINGNFGINQRGVSGTVTLAAGAYGHDRWKAGASGCTYTFATTNNVTTLTISAGSLIQVIEDINLFTGTYVLSWTGTAQGKIGAGSFGNSGITGSVTGGTNLNIEFGTGTVSLVKFEAGTVATPFEHRSFGQELALCQRYAVAYGGGSLFERIGTGVNGSTVVSYQTVVFPVEMRSAPSLGVSSNSHFALWNGFTLSALTSASVDVADRKSLSVLAGASGLTAQAATMLVVNNTASARMTFDAEL
jgi:hypothetical protein